MIKNKFLLTLIVIPTLPIIACAKSEGHIHTNYGGKCSSCGEVVNGLHFEEDTVKKMPDGGYPRLIRLKSGNLLYGYDDDGSVYSVVSNDNGETWSQPVKFSLFEQGIDTTKYDCANADFIELDNNDIIGCYRTVPNRTATEEPYKYDCSIRSSISHDGGHTWAYYATVASIYDGRDYKYTDKVKEIVDANNDHGGLWEPFTYQVGNKILCYYSDDFGGWYDASPNDHEFQYLCCKELDSVNKQWTKRHICINGLEIKENSDLPQVTSRDGMPVVAKMHDGTYVMAFEGTYRRKDPIKHPFITLLSHSNDGIHWSDPVEIYRPYGVGTKSGAAYIDVTDDDRLVVTFQTEEDYQEHGGTEMGEPHSITKVMISDGTPLDKIDRSCFYTAQDVFHEDYFKANSLWPMAVVENNKVYAFSGGKCNYSNIGKMNPINSYHPEVNFDSHEKITGNFVKLDNNYYRAKGENNILLKKGKGFISNVKARIFPRIRNDCGLIFNYNNGNYYKFEIGADRGALRLIKHNNNSDLELGINAKFKDEFSYDPNNLYECRVELLPNDNKINCYVNNELLISVNEQNIQAGGQIGYYSKLPGTLFSDFI